MWDGVAARLTERGHAALTVDLRGHGRSSKVEGPYDIPTVADDVAALIAAMGLDRPVVAGQSWGGNVVLELAARHPSAVRGIACVDGGWLEPSTLFASWEECEAVLAPPRLAGIDRGEIETYIRGAHPDWPEAGIAGMLANFEVLADGTIAPWLTYERHITVLRGLWAHHPSQIYANVPVPVLLAPAIGGGPEREAQKREDVARALALLPDARARWFFGDHDIHAQHPGELADVMIDVLAGAVTGMTAPARILAIMGSGETAPAMAKVHRALFQRLGGGPVPAAIIDTPYGFQGNADELSSRTQEFFATSVANPVDVATYRNRQVDAVTQATAVARIRASRYVMAGPGSPSYALNTWAGGPIPDALREKLVSGGVLTMASAAALTLGVVTIPVYEVYKVGEDPRWLAGLDLLGAATGLRAAVVPHYDNAEGGNHDTRFCYMGERRLRLLEAQLPEDAFVLGVDSHTALVMDLEAGTADIFGLGGVTVRVDGRSTTFAAGTEISIAALGEAARGLSTGQSAEAVRATAPAGGDAETRLGRPAAPLRDEMVELEGTFVAALESGAIRDAVAALLDLHAALVSRLYSGEDSTDFDNASATLRSLIVRLGEVAAAGAVDPRTALEPLVDALLELRAAARANRDWATADVIRDRLAAAGIEVRDGPDGATWVLAPAVRAG